MSKDDVILVLMTFILFLALGSARLAYNLGVAEGYIERDKMEIGNDWRTDNEAESLPSREQDQRFASEQDALNSPAYTHWASNYKVVEVSGA